MITLEEKTDLDSSEGEERPSSWQQNLANKHRRDARLASKKERQWRRGQSAYTGGPEYEQTPVDTQTTIDEDGMGEHTPSTAPIKKVQRHGDGMPPERHFRASRRAFLKVLKRLDRRALRTEGHEEIRFQWDEEGEGHVELKYYWEEAV